MKDTATRLFEWRQTRLNLKQEFSEKNLQEAINFWKSLDYSRHGFDYDRPHVWPDVWEYITEEFYTNSGNGLGCFYTIHHARPDLNPEVWLIHDLSEGDMYLVCYVDGYILNRITGKLDKLEEIRDDLDILERHDSNKIISLVKERNSNG
jgi:asparagine N-glycosylation enzyme membrane subunit Stt3